MSAAAAASAQASRARNVFISGHSLTDRPIPDDLAAIADSLGGSIDWNRQHISGSSIRERTAGPDPGRGWTGYASGVDKRDRPVDVLREFRSPGTRDGRPYDTLVVTEQHALLGTLIWNDTVRHLRHVHDRFVESSPTGITVFYEPWMSIDDKDRPEGWIGYERAASRIWRCIVARVNAGLVAAGRPDRIASAPAGLALSRLISDTIDEQAGGASQRVIVDRYVRDDVHPTRLGSYFLALVLYAAIEDRSPVGAWIPPGVAADEGARLQRIAWAANEERTATATSVPCPETDLAAFPTTYWAYVERAHWRKEAGLVAARLKRLREVARDRWTEWGGRPSRISQALAGPEGDGLARR